MNQADARSLVEQAPIARLASVTDLGAVDLVPITYAMSDDMLVTAIDHKPKTTKELKRLDNIRAHPEVALLVDHYDENWNELWWIRLRGRARILQNGQRFDTAVAALVAKYAPYQDRPPKGPIIEIDLTGWQWWTAKD